MIRIHRSTDRGLETIERPTKGCWIDVIDPDPDDAANLPRELSIPAEFVTYSLDLDKISLVEKTDVGTTTNSSAICRTTTRPTCPPRTRPASSCICCGVSPTTIHLSEIDKIVEELEDRLPRSLQNREVLERLQRTKLLPMAREDEDLLDDVFTEGRQAIGMSETASSFAFMAVVGLSILSSAIVAVVFWKKAWL